MFMGNGNIGSVCQIVALYGSYLNQQRRDDLKKLHQGLPVTLAPNQEQGGKTTTETKDVVVDQTTISFAEFKERERQRAAVSMRKIVFCFYHKFIGS